MDRKKKRISRMNASKEKDVEEPLGYYPNDRRLIYDRVDDYNDMDNTTYLKLTKVDNELKRPKEQVWGIDGYNSSDIDEDFDEEENDTELFKNDIESSGESSAPEEERVLGKKKKLYYGTDLTDQRIHQVSKSRSVKRAEALELEREGAKRFQNRMRQELETSSIKTVLPSWRQSMDTEVKTLPQQIEDIQLEAATKDKSEKSKSLRKRDPELYSMVEDLKEKTEELRSVLSPLIEAKKKGLIPTSPASNYLQTRYFLCLNYLSVISSYAMLKCSDVSLNHHPILSRLSQYRQLFKELEPCKEKYDSQLSSLLDDLKSGKLEKMRRRSERKVLNVLKKNDHEKEESDFVSEQGGGGEEEMLVEDWEEDIISEENSDVEEDAYLEEETPLDGEIHSEETLGETIDADGHRVISSTIAKNKGLLPSRKKEQRNPRVKYRKRYQDKLKRRKGQVREVRKEIDRYGGEASGIKRSLVKSVKFK